MRLLSSTVLASALLLTTLASPLSAQRGGSGWIGVSLDIPTVDGKIVGNSVIIAGVRRGSPAEEAGLRPGDRLLSIGDIRGPDDFRHLPERLRLHIGERVRVRIERDGRRREVVVRAAERPDDVRPQAIQIARETESLVDNMVRAMDSLRIELIQVRSGDRERGSTASNDDRSPRFRIVPDDDRPATVSTPFEFFVFPSEAHDSLQRAMEDLKRLTEELRRQEQSRIAELSRSVARFGNVDVDIDVDEELRMVRTALEEVTRESAELRAAMSDAARASAGASYTVPGWSSPVPVWAPTPTPEPEPEPQEPTTFRPLTPYLLGSNMVAGAHVIDLRPELARYFGVEGGILIVDVAPGTPASMAGLVPGDVITRLDQVAVRSVEEFRFGVSRADQSLPLSLVRQGSTVEVLLRR